MNEIELLAYEYSLGLLSKKEVAQLSNNNEFNQYIKQLEHQLTQLNIYAPLTRQQSNKIWENIFQHIEQSYIAPTYSNISLIEQFKNKCTCWINHLSFKLPYAMVSMVGLLLVFGIIFNQYQTSDLRINHLEWDIQTNVTEKTIDIMAINHQHTDNNTSCVLWVKHQDQFTFIGRLPETGNKSLSITSKLLSILKKGEIIISVENLSTLNQSTSFKSPSRIEFMGKWSLLMPAS